MARHLRGQLDDVAVRIAEIYRVHESVIGDAARLYSALLSFGHHRQQRGFVDFEGDVQVEVALALEFERQVRSFEKCDAGAVIHLEERVQGVGSARICFFDLERSH